MNFYKVLGNDFTTTTIVPHELKVTYEWDQWVSAKSFGLFVFDNLEDAVRYHSDGIMGGRGWSNIIECDVRDPHPFDQKAFDKHCDRYDFGSYLRGTRLPSGTVIVKSVKLRILIESHLHNSRKIAS